MPKTKRATRREIKRGNLVTLPVPTPVAVPPSDGGALLTKRELALRLRRTTKTVEDWMKKRRIPYLKIGRSVLFSWVDVERHLRETFQVSAA